MSDTPKQDALNISSNVLFHFTNSLDNLINILENDFSPRFCPEYALFESVNGRRPKPPNLATAMICFCDLPFFLIKKHLKFYGSYGIGLSKKWGIEKGVTPVMYVHPKSKTLEPLVKLNKMSDSNIKRRFELSGALASFTQYLKRYDGPAWRNGRFLKYIKFYDEREWRYVPIAEYRVADFVPPFFPIEKYSDKNLVKETTTRLGKKHTLTFTPNDIEYIIVRDEGEVLPMIRHIERIKGKYSSDEVKILTTAIMSANRIWEDF